MCLAPLRATSGRLCHDTGMGMFALDVRISISAEHRGMGVWRWLRWPHRMWWEKRARLVQEGSERAQVEVGAEMKHERLGHLNRGGWVCRANVGSKGEVLTWRHHDTWKREGTRAWEVPVRWPQPGEQEFLLPGLVPYVPRSENSTDHLDGQRGCGDFRSDPLQPIHRTSGIAFPVALRFLGGCGLACRRWRFQRRSLMKRDENWGWPPTLSR